MTRTEGEELLRCYLQYCKGRDHCTDWGKVDGFLEGHDFAAEKDEVVTNFQSTDSSVTTNKATTPAMHGGDISVTATWVNDVVALLVVCDKTSMEHIRDWADSLYRMDNPDDEWELPAAKIADVLNKLFRY